MRFQPYEANYNGFSDFEEKPSVAEIEMKITYDKVARPTGQFLKAIYRRRGVLDHDRTQGGLRGTDPARFVQVLPPLQSLQALPRSGPARGRRHVDAPGFKRRAHAAKIRFRISK